MSKGNTYFKGQMNLLRSLFPRRVAALSIVLVALLSICLSLWLVRLGSAQNITVATPPGTASVLRTFTTAQGIEVRDTSGSPIFRLEPGGFVRFFGVVVIQQAIGAGSDPIEIRDTTGAPVLRVEGRTVHFLGDVIFDGATIGVKFN